MAHVIDLCLFDLYFNLFCWRFQIFQKEHISIIIISRSFFNPRNNPFDPHDISWSSVKLIRVI